MCHFWVGHGTEPLDFDALYARGHADLVQQTFLLTAGRRRATRAVRRAFGAAAHRWAEIGELPDPAAWVRARAFDAALSPGTAAVRAAPTSGSCRTAGCAWRRSPPTRPPARFPRTD